MHSSYKILVADDHAVVRTGISLVLKAAFVGAGVTQTQDFESAIHFLSTAPFDLLLLDIDLPGGKSTKMIARIKEANPHVKIVMFSAYDEETYAPRYLRAGASGYINKLSAEEEIVEAVRAVLEHGEYKSQWHSLAAADRNDNPLSILSKREYEIMTLLVHGEGNLEIVNLLDIQMSTVSTYKKRIFEKLNVSNLPSLIEIFKTYDEN